MIGATPYLLSYAFNTPIGLAGPVTHASQLALAQDFKLPPKTNYLERNGANAFDMAGTNTVLDLAAPGVRDNIANPSAFARTAYRSSLFDTHRTENNAPIWNNDTMYDFFTSKPAQKRGSYWWEATHVQQNFTAGFVERGEFSVPKTGFTAFRYLRPSSTMKAI